MPDMRLGEIKELTEKMFTVFTPEYVKAMGVAMIDQAKRRRGSATDRVVPYKLLQMPPASDPLISGTISKRVSEIGLGARFTTDFFGIAATPPHRPARRHQLHALRRSSPCGRVPEAEAGSLAL
jgi:hypothetical protein